jgi:hypothetical protein
MRASYWFSFRSLFRNLNRVSRRRRGVHLPYSAEVLEYRLCLSGAPVISDLCLQYDTGEEGDNVTEDPTITGTITNEGSTGNVELEIDFNADGIADDWTYGPSGGNFVYDPSDYISFGQVTIAVRAVEMEPEEPEMLFGEWVSITFNYQAPPNDPPSIGSLTLQNDTGTPGDNSTEDPTLTGTVQNDGPTAGMGIEVDYDGDGIADDWFYAGADGSFEFDPSSHIGFGEVTVRVRAFEMDENTTETLYGDWASITFNYQAPPNDPPSIASLSLKNDTGDVGDNVTTDPTLIGSIQNDGSNTVEIEFDFDGDGAADDWCFAEPDGSFEFDPSGHISSGEVTVWVRAFEIDPNTTENIYGEWVSITFTFDLP